MTGIPTFPAFRRIRLRDQPTIEALTARFPPFSDFAFTSLWCWDTDEQCTIAVLNGSLVVRLKDYASDAHFYSFLGDQAVPETALALLARARAEGLPARLALVPEAVVAESRLPDSLAITPDRDNFDYLYVLDDLAELAGGKFREHRKKIARLGRAAALAFRPLDLRDTATQEATIALFRQWETQKPPAPGERRDGEFAALRRLFALAGEQRLWACGVDDGNRLVAFSVAEGLPGGDYAVIHFQKADRDYDGLASWLCQEEARLLRGRGYRLLNMEQDLGIPGLRAHKLSLRPGAFLRKFIIAERPGYGA